MRCGTVPRPLRALRCARRERASKPRRAERIVATPARVRSESGPRTEEPAGLGLVLPGQAEYVAALERSAAVEPAAIIEAREPAAIARQLIDERFSLGTYRLIHTWRGDLWRYTGTHFAALDADAVRSVVWKYLEHAQRRGQNGLERVRPTMALVSSVIDALRGVAYQELESAPAWIDELNDPPASEIVSCANGLIHLPERKLMPHCPSFFTTHALPFSYDADAGPAEEWLRFLLALWPDDAHAIETLQEIFGYVLSGDRRQQKLFMLVGPKRAGKDTIARVLRRLIGEANCAGPTLSSLGAPFGLQALLDKPLAVIADARISGRSDLAVVAERLLTITGEGHLSVDRKHRDAWTGQLPTRFLMLTNELPRLEDASGALASRFLILTLSQSWYGREDITLFARLERELPAILLWALDGLDRLRDRGRFLVPESSAAAMRELDDLGSPVAAFVRDRCALEPDAWTDCGELYAEWQRDCTTNGRHATSRPIFSRDLHSAFPQIKTMAKRTPDRRIRAFAGIRIRLPLEERGSVE